MNPDGTLTLTIAEVARLRQLAFWRRPFSLSEETRERAIAGLFDLLAARGLEFEQRA